MNNRTGFDAALYGVIALLFGIIAAIAGLFLWQGYRDSLANGDKQAVIAARTIAAHFEWIAEASRQALRRIDDTAGFYPEILTAQSAQDLNNAVRGLPADVQARVFNADGWQILSTSPAGSELSVADREYFQELRDGPGMTVISPLLFDRVTGDRSFVIARRLEREGRFAGAAAIVIPTRIMGVFWESLELGEASTISLLRDDGWLVARFPPAEAPMNLTGHPLFMEHLPRSESGSYYSAQSPADGHARLVGYKRVPNAPLVAIAAVSVQATLADFRSRAIWMAAAAIPVMAGLIGMTWWVWGLRIRDRKRRRELEDALDQNRLLLREIHHRIKNNLQTVSSMVRLQPLPAETKLDITNRITAMAAVHEQIYRTDRLGDVNLKPYLEGIVSDVHKAYNAAARISCNISPVVLDSERAMVLGLIVTEVVSNSFKHGLKEGQSGKLQVSLHEAAGRVRLIIRDNGVGFDAESVSEGLGFRLIRSFVHQIGGEYELSGENGLFFQLILTGKQPPEEPAEDLVTSARLGSSKA